VGVVLQVRPAGVCQTRTPGSDRHAV